MSTSLDGHSAEVGLHNESGEPDLPHSYSSSPRSGGTVGSSDSIIAEIEGEIKKPVEPWEKCATFVWDREKGRINDWNRELDAMLLFAGLFSAAVTAFSVPYYTSSFTPATTVALVQTLAQLSQTLAVNNQGPNTSHSALATSVALDVLAQTTSKESPIRVNALWFVALVFSLSAASIAIYIKQWLTQLAAPMTSMPRQSVVIWYRRHRSIQQWAIPSVIALVPCLLQIALIIFLAGLVLLLWTLETTLFAVVMPLVGLLMLFSICIAVLPSIAANCPYKSPQALIVVNIFTMISTLVSLIRNMIHTPNLHSDPTEKHHHGPSHSSDILKSLGYSINLSQIVMPTFNDARNWIIYMEWQDYERYTIKALDLEYIPDAELLVVVDDAMKDDGFLDDVLKHYVMTSPYDHASKALFKVYQNRIESFSDNNSISRDAASQIERMALRIFEDILKKNPSSPFVPNELIGIFELLLHGSRFPVFQMLFEMLHKFDGDHNDSLHRLMLIVVGNLSRFAHHLNHKFYIDFIKHISDMLNKDNTTGVVQTTLEVLLTCGTHPETSKEEMHLIGRNIYKAFSQYSGGSNQRIDASSNTECVAYLDVVDACLAATEKRISAFLTMSEGEYHALSEKTQEDDGNGEDVAQAKKKLQDRMVERTKEKSGFMKWRERLSAIRKMQRSAANPTEFDFSMNYGDIAADLPCLGLKEADVFRFSYLFFE